MTTAGDSLTGLPDWPRFLSRTEAARYVGVSTDTFDAEVAIGRWPQGLARGAKGGRLTWDRARLDAAADRLARDLAPPGSPAEDPTGDEAAAAAARERVLQERMDATYGPRRIEGAAAGRAHRRSQKAA